MRSPLFRPNGRSHPRLRTPVTVRVDARFDASPERVFDAWLDPGVARRWLFATATRPLAHVEIDARIPGSFRFVEHHGAGAVEHRGEYLEIAPYRRLVFTLAHAETRVAAARVSVEVEARPKGANIALTHENVPSSHAEAVEARWTGMLYGLGVTLDSAGADPIAERPPLARRAPLRRPALGECQP